MQIVKRKKNEYCTYKNRGTTTQFMMPLWHTIITDGSTTNNNNNNKLCVIKWIFSSYTGKIPEMDQQPLFLSVANRFIGFLVIYDFPTKIVHEIYESTCIICLNSLILLDLITLITLHYHQNIFISITNISVNKVQVNLSLSTISHHTLKILTRTQTTVL